MRRLQVASGCNGGSCSNYYISFGEKEKLSVDEKMKKMSLDGRERLKVNEKKIK